MRRAAPANWALGPEAVQRIRWTLVHHPDFAARRELDRWRNTETLVQLQYDLGDRNQETLGPRWLDYDLEGATVQHVEACSRWTCTAERTSGSTRLAPLPPTIGLVLPEWRRRLVAAGCPTGGSDFVLPGVAADGHLTHSQSKNIGRRFKLAAALVADEHPHLADIRGATLYALRRGAISLRLRAGDDEGTVADDCGTSVAMLRAHYRFALDAFKADGPVDADSERQAAYDLVWGRGTVLLTYAPSSRGGHRATRRTERRTRGRHRRSGRLGGRHRPEPGIAETARRGWPPSPSISPCALSRSRRRSRTTTPTRGR